MQPAFERIWIDDEPYALVLPTYEILREMSELSQASDSEFIDISSNCFVYHPVAASPTTKDLRLMTAFNVRDRYLVHGHANLICGWRPMLVPLTKSGEVSQCFRSVRNGTIVFGGTFQYCGTTERYRTPSPYTSLSEPVVGAIKDFSKVRLYDSNEDTMKNIPWVVWKGKLVCSRILIGKAKVQMLEDSHCLVKKASSGSFEELLGSVSVE